MKAAKNGYLHFDNNCGFVLMIFVQSENKTHMKIAIHTSKYAHHSSNSPLITKSNPSVIFGGVDNNRPICYNGAQLLVEARIVISSRSFIYGSQVIGGKRSIRRSKKLMRSGFLLVLRNNIRTTVAVYGGGLSDFYRFLLWG